MECNWGKPSLANELLRVVCAPWILGTMLITVEEVQGEVVVRFVQKHTLRGAMSS